MKTASISSPFPAKLHERLERFAKDMGESLAKAVMSLTEYALEVLGC